MLKIDKNEALDTAFYLLGRATVEKELALSKGMFMADDNGDDADAGEQTS